LGVNNDAIISIIIKYKTDMIESFANIFIALNITEVTKSINNIELIPSKPFVIKAKRKNKIELIINGNIKIF